MESFLHACNRYIRMLHTCLRTSNPYGIFSIITKLSQEQLIYHSQKNPSQGRGDTCEGENLGVNPNRHEFRVREMLVETRIVCVMTNVF